MSRSWHITRDARRLTLSRLPLAHFDVSAEALFPPLRMLRLAHMIRQDMWRLLRRLRGFAPVVQVTRTATGLHVLAGGSVAGRFPEPQSSARLHDLLRDPARRDRWQRCAMLTPRKDLL